MKESHRRNGELERRIVDFVEAAILEPHVGQEFDALVVEAGEKSGSVQLLKRAVVGHCKCPGLELGIRVRVKLKEADPDKIRSRVRARAGSCAAKSFLGPGSAARQGFGRRRLPQLSRQVLSPGSAARRNIARIRDGATLQREAAAADAGI